MAQVKTVYTVERLQLLDGTEVEVRNLPIKKLRRANDLINKAMSGTPVIDEETGEQAVDDDGQPLVEQTDDAMYDAFFDIVEMVMEGQKSCAKFLDEDGGRELLEDTMDQFTLYEIVKVSSGFDFLAMQKRIEQMMERDLIPRD